ncbi:MAG TPA: ABC transporter permease [Terriglobales bacterium]|jgi:putative ABC transport system permease protein|nr:ABC transporter permease [Terriglobales bacterium]
MTGLLQDLKYAMRQFRRAPGFTAAAVVTLALGIGANTGIFSLVDQLLLRRLPTQEPDRLVMLKFTGSDTGATSSYGGDSQAYFSYPMYRDLRDQNNVFAGALCMFPTQVGVQWRNVPSLANSELVSGNYFSLLGVKAALGRLLVPEDSATSGSSPLVVLSYRYWKQHLASDPAVLNQSILINGNLFTIVGVAQPGFDSVIAGTVPDFFVPITMKARMTPGWDDLEDHRSKWLNIVARLKPGLTAQQAEAGINPLWKSLRTTELASIPSRSQRFREQFVEKSSLILLDGSKGFSPLRENMRTPLLILMGMVGLLTLMATANVGSLLLVRAAGRIREMSVRYALGAARPRVIRQLLVEGLALGLTGGILGLALAPLLTGLLISFVDPDATTAGMTSLSASPDMRVMLFCLAVSVVASALFSLAPILQFYRPEVTPALKQQTVTAQGSHARFRRVTVGVQIGLSLLLLVAAGLFGRTLKNLKSVDVGFATDHILTFQLDPRMASYEPSRVAPLYKRLLETLATQPGVQSVGMTDDPDLAQNDSTYSIEVPGYQPQEGEGMSFEWERVTPAYFSTLQLPVIAGRAFSDGDDLHAAKVVIVNESFVRKFFGNADQAIGRTFSEKGAKGKGPLLIVGVVKDAKHFSLHDQPKPIFYSPLFQETEPKAVGVYVRTRQEPEAAGSTVRTTLSGIDSKLVADSMRSMNNLIDSTLTYERMLSLLATGFGIVAIFVTAIGLYGVLAYSIAQRTREIGIRMALGATQRSVVKMVLREVLILTGISVGLALPLSLALSRLVKSQLFGISERDPATLLLVTLAIGMVALLAAWAPARRATQVQPITALRYE